MGNVMGRTIKKGWPQPSNDRLAGRRPVYGSRRGSVSSAVPAFNNFRYYFATCTASSNFTDNNFEIPSFPIVTP